MDPFSTRLRERSRLSFFGRVFFGSRNHASLIGEFGRDGRSGFMVASTSVPLAPLSLVLSVRRLGTGGDAMRSGSA